MNLVQIRNFKDISDMFETFEEHNDELLLILEGLSEQHTVKNLKLSEKKRT